MKKKKPQTLEDRIQVPHLHTDMVQNQRESLSSISSSDQRLNEDIRLDKMEACIHYSVLEVRELYKMIVEKEKKSRFEDLEIK